MSTASQVTYDAHVDSDDEEQTQIRSPYHSAVDACSSTGHWEDEPLRPHRRRPKTHKSRPSRRVVSSGSSASSHTSADARSFLPSLGRILEGRPSEDSTRGQAPPQLGTARNMHSRPVTAAREPTKRHVGSNKQLQDRVRALVSPSQYSILSTQTTATSSSSGSGSTVTQGSYGRSTSSRGSRGSRDDQDHVQQEHPDRRRRKRRKHRDETVDVFSFLESDPADENTGWQSSSCSSDEDTHGARPPSAPRSSSESPVVHYKPLRGGPWPMQEQLHSDSGISIRSSSPDSVERAGLFKAPASERPHDQDEQSAELPAHHTTDWQRRMSSSSSQDLPIFYALPNQLPRPNTTLVPYTRPPQYPDPGQLTRAPEKDEAKGSQACAGYELLASRLSSHSSSEQKTVTPVYRKFERLNHRILLHLQDELAELEEQLEDIDRCLANFSGADDKARPASRRADARYGDELHFRRTELLGLIFLKIKQYNKALVSFQGVVKGSDQASEDQLSSYRELTDELKPVVQEELRFLDRSTDLISMCSRPRVQGQETWTRERILLLGPPAAMIFASLLLAVTPGFASRLTLLLGLTGVGLGAMHFTGLAAVPVPYWEKVGCLMLYVLVLIMMAGTLG